MSDGQRAGVLDGTSSAHPASVEEPSDRQLMERFAAARDADAFAALIRRHGPMVLGVCRRVLGHEQEAEDAFQATFMVLVRKGGSLRQPELLGNWLYGVAYRIAHKARTRMVRHRDQPLQVDPMTTTDPHADLFLQELRGLLDEELKALPAKYRAPLVLCYLEGLTNEEAARRLHWPSGSMSYRLARGREMLRERLRARRQMLLGVMLAALTGRKARAQDVPPHLMVATLKAALDGARPPVPDSVPAAPSRAPAAPATSRPWPSRITGSRYAVLAIALAGLLAAGTLAYAGLTDGLASWLAGEPPPLGGSTTPGETVTNPPPCHR